MTSIFDEELADFISYIASEKGVSHNTIEAYGRDLRFLINKLKTLSLESFKDASVDHLVSFFSILSLPNMLLQASGVPLLPSKSFSNF